MAKLLDMYYYISAYATYYVNSTFSKINFAVEYAVKYVRFRTDHRREGGGAIEFGSSGLV